MHNVQPQSAEIPNNAVCNICGLYPFETPTGRLIRDHDHTTKIIRGYLCDKCNAWLSILERHPEFYYLRCCHKLWREWVRDYSEQIAEHLTIRNERGRYHKKYRSKARPEKHQCDYTLTQSNLLARIIHIQKKEAFTRELVNLGCGVVHNSAPLPEPKYRRDPKIKGLVWRIV